MRLFAVAALAVVCHAAASPANVLFLVADDLKPSIGAFGNKLAVTPNLDNLAKDSALFTQASVQQSVCNPSRSSFLTGRRVDSLRVWDLQTCWRTGGGVNATSMPQHFKQQGFRTGGGGKIFHPVYNNHTKTTNDIPYSWPTFYEPPAASDRKYSNLSHTFWAAPDSAANAMPDWYIANNCVEALRNASSSSSPFFLACGVHRPHLPFCAPQSYFDLYPLPAVNQSLPAWPYRPHNYGNNTAKYGWDPQSGPRHCEDITALNVSFPYGYIPLSHGVLMKQAYLAAASYTDRNIGLVLQALKDSGKYDETAIVFLGDHGWQLGQHGEWGKKTTFQESVVAPLMFKPPASALPPSARRPSRARFDPSFAEPGSSFRQRIAVDSPVDATAGEAAIQARRAKEVPAALQQYRKHEFASGLAVSDALVEFVSIYPTLADLVGVPVPPTCPAGPAAQQNTTCVEGASFAGAVKLALAGQPVRAGQAAGGAPIASFSQYPHCMHDVNEDDFWGCHDPALAGHQPRFMGYTILAEEQGSLFRYVRWVNFTSSTATPHWDELLAEELYSHATDPTEDFNVAEDPSMASVKAKLHQRLVAGWRAAM